MAKYLVKFNNKEYLIDETKFEPAISRLAAHLTEELQGTGATVTLGGVRYSLNGDKINTAAAGFASYLETIAGTDMKATVGGQEYGLSKTKLQNATDTMHETLDGMANPPKELSQGLEYSLNDDGASYYVKGIGTCTDTDVVIPSSYNGLPVTAIGVETYDMYDYVGFYGCDQITSVIIPDSVTYIGCGAFSGCDNLTSVTIPDGVTHIGEFVFWSDKLTTITLPSSVTHIGYEAFGFISVLTFNGTVEQWSKIYLYDEGYGTEISQVRLLVQCTDGEVVVHSPLVTPD